MKFHNITRADMLNGEGLRVVLWVSGCSHRCHACQNPITWDPNDGVEFDEVAIKEIYEELDKDWCCGLTLSGGDPLFLGNRSVIAKLVSDIKRKYPSKNIWCYTGYTWEELIEQLGSDKDLQKIFSNIDVLLEGRFMLHLALEKLHYVGSSNQRIIDVKRSLETNKICLYIDNSEVVKHEDGRNAL